MCHIKKKKKIRKEQRRKCVCYNWIRVVLKMIYEYFLENNLESIKMTD